MRLCRCVDDEGHPSLVAKQLKITEPGHPTLLQLLTELPVNKYLLHNWVDESWMGHGWKNRQVDRCMDV